jgi:hypothetical protein
MPPAKPAIRPLIGGTPESKAIPRHNGTATRKTTNAAGKSDFNELKYLDIRHLRTAKKKKPPEGFRGFS